MKFVQILVFYMPNIANMSLAQCWGLETNTRPKHETKSFMISLKLQYTEILPFLMVGIYHF